MKQHKGQLLVLAPPNLHVFCQKKEIIITIIGCLFNLAGFLFGEELGCSTCSLQVLSWRPIILQVLAPIVVGIISSFVQKYG